MRRGSRLFAREVIDARTHVAVSARVGVELHQDGQRARGLSHSLEHVRQLIEHRKAFIRIRRRRLRGPLQPLDARLQVARADVKAPELGRRPEPKRGHTRGRLQVGDGLLDTAIAQAPEPAVVLLRRARRLLLALDSRANALEDGFQILRGPAGAGAGGAGRWAPASRRCWRARRSSRSPALRAQTHRPPAPSR